VQSFTSVFQPGTAFMWCALAKTTSKLPSRRLKTGFQYTLVDSIATCVHAACDCRGTHARARERMLRWNTRFPHRSSPLPWLHNSMFGQIERTCRCNWRACSRLRCERNIKIYVLLWRQSDRQTGTAETEPRTGG